MNCQACKTHLHPALDDELGMEDNLSVLEHLESCSTCATLFDDERKCWEHVRTTLRAEVAPAALKQRVARSIDDHEARARRTHTLRWVVPVLAAASLLAIFLIRPWEQTGTGKPPHSVAGHGTTVAAATSLFNEVKQKAADMGIPMVSPKLLSEGTYEILEGKKANDFLCEVLGNGSPFMENHCQTSFTALRSDIELDGAQGCSYYFEDQHKSAIGVFRIPASAARLNTLIPIEEGSTREVTVEQCSDCNVVAVKRNNSIYLIVTSDRRSLDDFAQSIR